jgi:protocatechuate 3,4-dioxygenase, alpha subunit
MRETPSQTVGPFFAILLDWHGGPYAAPEDAPDGCWLAGTVYDGAGEPVPDALVEIWQPAPLNGFARCLGRADGGYRLWIRRPGPNTDGQAPHVALSVFARGLIDRVVTRVYFPEDADGHATDPVLKALGDHAGTLVAAKASFEQAGSLDASRPRPAQFDGYRFDIHLQGPHETVFFSI